MFNLIDATEEKDIVNVKIKVKKRRRKNETQRFSINEKAETDNITKTIKKERNNKQAL